ncbi:uncharacterized protein LOC122009770 isoform X2 [Zingiber officinale]|uniref:uncharacterized protein LOC122009770 isoform X2 n=1 Tax=Zingiber officinale TaxID=94328 RepID=UPI001C4DD27E|nr:uncharacterized protein LOC122009770 isoform X2 [Zingiber officinale]
MRNASSDLDRSTPVVGAWSGAWTREHGACGPASGEDGAKLGLGLGDCSGSGGRPLLLESSPLLAFCCGEGKRKESESKQESPEEEEEEDMAICYYLCMFYIFLIKDNLEIYISINSNLLKNEHWNGNRRSRAIIETAEMKEPRPRNEGRGWSITVRAKSKGLDLRLSASNLFPHWNGSGGGGERISFFLRLRRRFFLQVESQNQRPARRVPALPNASSVKPLELAKRIFRRPRWFSRKKAAPKPGASSAIAKQHQDLVAAMAGILSLMKKKKKNRLGISIHAFASLIFVQEFRNTISRAEDAAEEKDDAGIESTGSVHLRDEKL